MLEACLRVIAALVIVSGLGVFGWTITLRLEGVARLARWVAAFVAAFAAATLVLLALAFPRVLGTPSMFVASLALAALGFRSAGRERVKEAFADDVRVLLDVPNRLGRPVTIALAVVAASHVLRAAAAASGPPLGFDSMSYHMVHVGYWAQDGGFARHAGVDSWSYYEFFPIGGEIFWAWVSIPTRSSVLVGPAGAFISAMTALGAVSAARSLGATLPRSVLAACALVSIPAVSCFATSGYVDNTALAFVVSATALIFAAGSAEIARVRGTLLVLSAAAFGIAVGVKTTMLPMLGLGLVASVALLVKRKAPAREIAIVAGASIALAVVIFGPRMLWIAAHTGSPVYPFPLKVLGKEVFRGNLGLQRLFLEPGKASPPLWELVRELFVPGERKPPINFGPSGLALFASALLGLGAWFRTRPRDARALFLFALIVPSVSFFVGDTTLGLRTIWWWVIARFMTPAAFAAVLFASTVRDGRLSRGVDVLLGFATLAGTIVPFTLGMCGYRWVGVVSIGIAVAVVVGLAVFVWKERRSAVPGILAFGIVGLAAVTVGLRGEIEGLIVRGASRGECFEAHPMRRPATGYPLWERLADAPSKRIAVAAGFEGIGHEVFRYPLLGGRWQHTLLYVPPAADGKLYDYHQIYFDDPPEKRPELSFDRWLERLRAERVDAVALLGPYNVIEHRWLATHPEIFTFEEIAETDTARLYVLKPR